MNVLEFEVAVVLVVIVVMMEIVVVVVTMLATQAVGMVVVIVVVVIMAVVIVVVRMVVEESTEVLGMVVVEVVVLVVMMLVMECANEGPRHSPVQLCGQVTSEVASAAQRPAGRRRHRVDDVGGGRRRMHFRGPIGGAAVGRRLLESKARPRIACKRDTG